MSANPSLRKPGHRPVSSLITHRSPPAPWLPLSPSHVPRSFLLHGFEHLFPRPGVGFLVSNMFTFYFPRGGLPEIPGQSGFATPQSQCHLWVFFIAPPPAQEGQTNRGCPSNAKWVNRPRCWGRQGRGRRGGEGCLLFGWNERDSKVLVSCPSAVTFQLCELTPLGHLAVTLSSLGLECFLYEKGTQHTDTILRTLAAP
ncbi:hypothetical protein HJG60_011314 [Phyllostomus discolor]|uniref:Uncharacterized protein n=1 Tax=Phyllostomus discolor TaxID=89673 RepID=A0A833ZXG3_9CHIR|nr:hypothetical protein HJG60_011314 [Phyllostomus discolor]